MPTPTEDTGSAADPSAETAARVHTIMIHLQEIAADDEREAEPDAARLYDRLTECGYDTELHTGTVHGDRHTWVEFVGKNECRWIADLNAPLPDRDSPLLLSTCRPESYQPQIAYTDGQHDV